MAVMVFVTEAPLLTETFPALDTEKSNAGAEEPACTLHMVVLPPLVKLDKELRLATVAWLLRKA